jgi:hypothetical protein
MFLFILHGPRAPTIPRQSFGSGDFKTCSSIKCILPCLGEEEKLFDWLKPKKPRQEAPVLEEGDKTFDAGNLILFWANAIREAEPSYGDAFRCWLLVYSMAAALAEKASNLEPIPIATSVASALFSVGHKEIADGITRMADNWNRLCTAYPEPVQLVYNEFAGMLAHPQARALMLLLDQMAGKPKNVELLKGLTHMVPRELVQPTIRTLDTLIEQADVDHFTWV